MTKGFGLYVHWPFCQAKCPYCDFNSHVWSEIDQTRWRSAYLKEIDRVGAEIGENTVLSSVFFGGGTPSLMSPETVNAILSRARSVWPASNDIEITLEANPTSVEAARFRGYADAGVNRVSVGIQALNDVDLKALGRLHSVQEARAAFDIARHTFGRVSFDLIYARQHQTLAEWKVELKDALEMAADHVSLYQLTIEPGTAFGDRRIKGGLGGLPEENLASDMYLLTQELTDGAGMPAYEISNHAVSGSESRHNLIYWRSHDWAGVGPGAHGRHTTPAGRFATEAHRMPADWLTAVETLGSGNSLRNNLSPEDVKSEALLMGLRLREGVAMPDELYNKYKELEDIGLLEGWEGRIRATQRGQLLLDAILRELLA